MQLLDTAAFNISTPFGRLYSAWYDHYMAPGVFKMLETDLHGRFMERVGSGPVTPGLQGCCCTRFTRTSACT